MAKQHNLEIKADTSKFKSEVSAAQRIAQLLKKGIIELAKSTVKLDGDQKVLSKTNTFLATSGETLTAVYARVKGQLQLATVSVNQNQEAVTAAALANVAAAAAVKKEQEAALHARQTQRRADRLANNEFIANENSKMEARRQAVFAEQNQSKKLVDRLRNKTALETESLRKQITAAEERGKKEEDINKKILDDKAKIAAKEAQRTQKLVSGLRRRTAAEEVSLKKQLAAANRRARLKDAELKRTTALRLAEEKLTRQRIAARQAAKTGTSRIVTGTDFSKATAEQKAAFIQQVGRLRELLAKHKFTTARINGLWRQVASGNIKQYTGSLRQVQSEMIKLQAKSKAFGVTQKDLTKGASKFVLTWKSLSRLLVIQLLHQAISSMSNALREAVGTARDLFIKLAEIQTIDVTGMGINELRNNLLQLSDAFGIPVIDQAEAAYQALSNQVVRGAETFKFLASANRLAIAGVTSSTNAVQLLSSAINAFNIPVSETERIAASFFKTVELGRVRIEEMAETFGRIAVPAAQLGVTLEELQAGITTATIRGIKFSESSTLLRNVLLKMIRPTEAMTDFFAELGVESGEAAIEVFGLQGFLAKLEEKAKGSSGELGELFGRIRAITGAMIFAGEGIKTFTRNLAQIQAPFEDFNRAVDTVIENTGQKLKIALNEIKNFFIKDFAGGIISILETVTFGFIEAKTLIIGTMKVMVAAVVSATLVMIVSMRKAMLAMVLTPIGLYIAGLTSAILLIVHLLTQVNKMAAAFEREFGKIEAARDRADARTDARFTQEINRLKRHFQERARLQLKSSSEIIAAYDREANQQKEIFEALNAAIEDMAKNSATIMSDRVKTLTKDIGSLQKEIESGKKAIENLRRKGDKQLFDISLEGLTPTKKISEIQKRIDSLREASKKAAFEGDTDTFEAVRREIESLFQTQLGLEKSLAAEFGFQLNKLKMQQQLKGLLEEERVLRTQMLDEQIRKEEEKQALKKKAVVEEATLSELTQKVVKFDSADVLASKDTGFIKEKFESQIGALKELIKLRNKFGLDKKRTADLGQKAIELETALTEKLNKLKLQQAQKDLIAKRKSLETSIQLTKTEKDKIQEDAKAIDRGQRKLTGLLNVILEKAPGGEHTQLAGFRPMQESFVKSPISGLLQAGANLFGTEGALGVSDITDAFKQDPGRQLGKLQEVFGEKTATLGDKLAVLNETIAGFKFEDDEGFADMSENAAVFQKSLFDLMTKMRTAQEMGGINVMLETQEKLVEALNELKKELTDNTVKLKDTGITTFAEILDVTLKDLNKNVVDFQGSVEKLAAEIARQGGPPPKDPPTDPPKTSFAGGRISFGTDTVPAMLTPGEFVVNRMATNRFLPQLLAMNSGIVPQSFAGGGQVTNVNGDFNISLASSGQTETDIVAIGRGLKNEIRRGRLTL